MAHEYHEDIQWNRSPTNVHDEDNDFCRNIIATKLSVPEFRRKPLVNKYSSPYARKEDEDESDVVDQKADVVNGEVSVVSEDEALHWDFRSCFKTLFVPDKVSGDAGRAEETDTNADQNVGLLEVGTAEGGNSDSNRQPKQSITSSEMTFSPDKNLDRLLNTERLDYHSDDDQMPQKYLKVKSKYVTDGQGVVSGVLLVTPQTVMFNPCVSDHLVMERGRDTYVVRLPLRAISRIALFEDVAAMVSGEMSKQYIPKEGFIDKASEDLLSPKPGLIVRQPTGELYVLPDSNTTGGNHDKCIQSTEGNEQLTSESTSLPPTTRSRCNALTMDSNTTIDVSDQGIGSCSEPLSKEDMKEDIALMSPTTTTSLGEGGDGCAGCGNYSEFMEDGQLSSTPKHRRYSTTNADTAGTLCGGDVRTDTVDEGGGGGKLGLVRESIVCGKSGSVGDVATDCVDARGSCEGNGVEDRQTANDGLYTNDLITETLVENHFDITAPEKGDGVDVGNASHTCVNSPTDESAESKLAYFEYGDRMQGNDSKDSGISELSSANLTEGNESKEGISSPPPGSAPLSSPVPPTADPLPSSHIPLSRGSSLSDEARQWLGKRGVRLSLDQGGAVHYMPDQHENGTAQGDSRDGSTTGRIDDPLMYMSIKVIRSYWCPIRVHQNQIMGVPLNRDQKRREHWFAMPRERVDQFYNFLHYWAPDVYNEDSSGFSTPCSSECENFEEKAKGVDVPGMKIHRSWSLYSVSSKSSTRSLGEDEIPDLQAESQILTRKQVHLLTRKLPSRTVGHSWELIYSTTIHGISLSTLYRNFHGYDTPVLIVVKDENQKVFGAFMSEVPKISEGFYGTGESMLYTFMTETSLKLYNWTGDNNFFIKGSKTSLVIGGGEGMFGLWLDEDLYRGRSHACRTFANETLSTSEDFICCGLEAWGFV